MGNNSLQGMKVPMIVVGVAVVVVAAGILVRSLNTPSSPVTSEPVSGLAPEPAPSAEPEPQIRFSSLAATDDNGDNWRLGLKGIPSQQTEGCTKAGAPLLVKADVRGAGRNIFIGLRIEGQAGEVYEPGAVRNGRRLPAPTFKIF
ncbi:MAG: hypothetical protein JSW59_09760, partial [Phycisphaerales bacterium]